METTIEALSKDLATERCDEIVELLSRIPGYSPTSADVLAEEKHGLALTAKWELSLIALNGAHVIGVAIRYRREVELPHYPAPTVYGNGFAVRADVEGTGLGSALFDTGLKLADTWIESNEPGICCSLQTNAAPFNNRVRSLYARRGFVVTSEKQYENRKDVVMMRPPGTRN